MGMREKMYGLCFSIFRMDRISIEIWSDNVKLKNELYEKVRLFVCGMMKSILEDKYESLKIFDNTIRGQRSNNYSYNFGISLAGAQITFDADYMIEQSIIDTDLQELNKDIILEVINHVKGE
jgi:hypothetical protein